MGEDAEPEPEPAAAETEPAAAETGGKLEKIPEPDRDVHKAAVEKIQAEIAKKQERMNSIRDAIERQSDARKRSREGQGGIRGELATVRKARQAKIEEKKAIRSSMGGGRIDVPSKKDRPRVSVEEVDKRIRKLEDRQATESLTLKEEKEVVQEIKALRQSRAGIAEFDANLKQLMGAKEAQDLKFKEFKTVLASLDGEIDALSEQQNALKTTIDAQNAKEKNDIPALIAERDILRPEISALYDEMRKIRDENKKENDIWWEHEQKWRVQDRAEKQIKYDEQRKRKLVEDEEYRQIREQEDMDREPMNPFEEDKLFCENLVIYLKSLTEGAKEETAKIFISAEGAIGKNAVDDNLDSWGGLAKKKKGKKKKGMGPKSGKIMQHPVAKIGAFHELKLEPPKTPEEIPGLLETLAGMMKDYDAKAASMAPTKKKGMSKPRKVAFRIQPRGESDLKVIIDVIPGN